MFAAKDFNPRSFLATDRTAASPQIGQRREDKQTGQKRSRLRVVGEHMQLSRRTSARVDWNLQGTTRCQYTATTSWSARTGPERPDTVLESARGMATEQTLPGLRGLAKLADLRPIIAVDSREKEPLKFTRLQAVTWSLFTGDYSIRGLEDSFAVERKSIDDLANCCLSSNRDRFEHELHRLRGYRFKRLLVVGSREDIAAGLYHSRIASKAVLATLSAFEVRYDLPVVFAETPQSAALQIERWAFYFAREVVENANNLLRGCLVEAVSV
jgi:DNA excision repair protein ERCC-4